MQRTQIYLETRHQKALKSIAQERATTLSHLIREAIEELISHYQKPKKDSLDGIVGLYQNKEDSQGSFKHDDLYA